MSDYKTSGKQLAKNTVYLYLRQLLTMIVSLLTVRVTIKTLGVEDYGINNVVAGTVSMFGFLSGAMATGTQRYFSYYIGTGELEKLKRVFKLTFTIYFILVIVIVVLQEIVGLWFLNNKLVLPPERLAAAHCVFQFAVIGSGISILQSPYMASVIAHENMKIFAQVGIVEAVMKLLVVYLLFISPYDKLISYGLLYLLLGLCFTAFYQYYTRKHYTECSFGFLWDKSMAKEIMGFNGWNLFGSFAWVMKNQGLSMLLNTFFGPVVNASQHVGTQVRTIATNFSQNFSAATRPQIIKSYAVKDYDRLFRLVYRTAKMNYILMFAVTLPVLFHIEYVFDLWLDTVPLYAAVICKLLLVENLVETSSLPFATVNQATGKIALYQFLIGFVGLLNIPFAYIACNMGYQPEVAFTIGVCLQVIIAGIRILFVQRVKAGLVWDSVKNVYAPCALMSIIAYVVSYFAYIPATNFVTLVSEISLQVLFVLFLSYLFCLEKEERHYIVSIIREKCKL